MDITSILTAVIGVIVVVAPLVIQHRLQALREQRQKLREQRLGLYITLLSPYVRLWASLNKPNRKAVERAVIQEMLSTEQLSNTFQFGMIGSDDVVQKHNAFRQFAANAPSGNPTGEFEGSILECFGELLLAIRRDLGNKNTKLQPIDMFKPIITDLQN